MTGSRNWRSRSPIYRALIASKATIVVHGGAQGADDLAAQIARSLGLQVRAYPADWTRYGRSAGPRRNQEMLDAEHRPDEPIDLVLAFPTSQSVGTYDMISRAERAGIRVILPAAH